MRQVRPITARDAITPKPKITNEIQSDHFRFDEKSTAPAVKIATAIENKPNHSTTHSKNAASKRTTRYLTVVSPVIGLAPACFEATSQFPLTPQVTEAFRRTALDCISL